MSTKQKTKKYKLKTHKATSKRFRTTGSGKLMRTKGGKGHLRRNRSSRAKGELDQMKPVEGKNIEKTVRRLAPYLDKKK